MARSDWEILERDDGRWNIYWRGRLWPVEPRASRERAEDYLRRAAHRYPGETPGILLGDEEEESEGRQRGGPWRYRYPDGDDEVEGVIHTSAKTDAKETLRRKLDRQRLPNGITWEIADDLPKP